MLQTRPVTALPDPATKVSASAMSLVLGTFGAAPTTEAVLMPLSEDDVREILRLIDESDDEELRSKPRRFSLYVRRSGGRRHRLRPRAGKPRPVSALSTSSTRRRGTGIRAYGALPA